MPNHPSRRETAILLSIVLFLAAGVIWVRTATVRETYAFVQKERELRKLQQEIQAARVRWLKVTAPKRLESMARSLGLAPAKIHQVLKYEPEKAVVSAYP